MKSYDDDPDPESTDRSSPERVLALSVIALAVNDARSGNDAQRRRAIGWLLENDGGLGFWARLGDVQVEALRDMVRREFGTVHQASLL